MSGVSETLATGFSECFPERIFMIGQVAAFMVK
jgi:hypothetical protein